MKQVGRRYGIALLIGFLWMLLGLFTAWNAVAEMHATGAADTGNLENIILNRAKGKERVTFVATRISTFKVEEEAGNTVLLKLENLSAPEILRRPFSDEAMINVLQVVAEQKTVQGKPWVHAAVYLKQPVPYSVRQEGQNVILDFNVASLGEAATPSMEKKTAPEASSGLAPENQKRSKASENRKAKKAPVADESSTARYTGQKISLDFQDADIRAVLRLLAETGGVSIVAGPDVKGSVNVHMRDVPWDQALETILDIHGLAKKEMGNVISVMSLEKKKKDEEVRKAAEKDQIEAEANRKKREQDLLAEKGRLRQISIEAKIVEASEEFIKNLGVTWGGAVSARMGSYPFQAAYGTNTRTTEGQTNPVSYPYPAGIGYTTSGTGAVLSQAAVNMPGSIIGTPTLGVVIGGSKAVLDVQIAALESTSSGKIISTPKVTTMDGVTAKIKQGEEIPYTTYDDKGYPRVNFKEAVLKLEVTPSITPDGRISMQINATNDRGDYAKAGILGDNVPIIKNEVDSKVVVEDGTTIVIGGVSKTTDDTSTSGVPWLSRIPVLGWLFKSENTDRTRKQLLIFVTPKIIPDVEPGAAAGIS